MSFDIAILEGQLPKEIWEKMKRSTLSSPAIIAAGEYEQLFRLSGTPFFREYTDHSFTHSLDVFKTACELFDQETLPALSPEDINILFLSCVVHDSGLHVTEDILVSLLDQSHSVVACPDFDDKPWPELWAEFVAEAKRFNEKQLIAIFGDSEQPRDLPRSVLDFTQRDRLLAGEFLRRNHTRYAHEMALGRIKSSEGDAFNQLGGFDNTHRDIVGLIARSHGVGLRSMYDYIDHRYHLRDFNRIHIVFLMIALRIADYMQIQPGRAPALFRHLHKIRSPYSAGEWRVHHAVENITTSSLDPEAIFVAANPLRIGDYLKLERWMQGLQDELDKSWAVLGEVYGRFTQEKLNLLGLKIRRVRSNIEDKKAYKSALRMFLNE